MTRSSARTRGRSAPAVALVGLVALLVAACGPRPGATGPSGPPSEPSGSRSQPNGSTPTGTPAPTGPSTQTALRVGLGYIPSVQFAPFYLAQQAGYYSDAGLDVTFENRIDPDLIPLVGQGAMDLGIADGTSVIPAVSQGIPIKYVATIYGTFPSVVFAKDFTIETVEDLRGRKIGIPGRYGSSWVMLQALLKSAGMTPDDVTIVEYPDFGQGVAVARDAVDAATGFVNNEPIQLRLSEENDVVIFHVDDVVALPGPGLIAGPAALEAKSSAIAAFLAATLRAMHDIEADPELGLQAAFVAVPELESQREFQEEVLTATIEVWAPASGEGDFGTIDRAGWEASIDYLAELGLVPNPVTVDDLVRSDLLPAPSPAGL